MRDFQLSTFNFQLSAFTCLSLDQQWTGTSTLRGVVILTTDGGEAFGHVIVIDLHVPWDQKCEYEVDYRGDPEGDISVVDAVVHTWLIERVFFLVLMKAAMLSKVLESLIGRGEISWRSVKAAGHCHYGCGV